MELNNLINPSRNFSRPIFWLLPFVIVQYEYVNFTILLPFMALDLQVRLPYQFLPVSITEQSPLKQILSPLRILKIVKF